MPILNRHLNWQVLDNTGAMTQVAPAVALAKLGPVFQVEVGLHVIIASELQHKGKEIPQPVAGLALIDTGATTTCIDNDVAQQLKLPIIGTGSISSATHEAQPANIYSMTMKFSGTNLSLDGSRVVGANLKHLNLVSLLGRDILQQCTLFYNGRNGQFTLAF